MTCRELNDFAKCDLVIGAIQAKFGDFILDSKGKRTNLVHHSVEVETHCINCGKKYWFTLQDLPVEKFGQIWRTAVFSKEYKYDNTT